jgi:hypothetical protein
VQIISVVLFNFLYVDSICTEGRFVTVLIQKLYCAMYSC